MREKPKLIKTSELICKGIVDVVDEFELSDHLFISKSNADLKTVMPTRDQLDGYIEMFEKARTNASNKYRKKMIKNIIREMKILKEQLL